MKKVVVLFLSIFLIIVFSGLESNQVFAAQHYVSTEAELLTALADTDASIDIVVTAPFGITQTVIIPAGKTVTITGETLTRDTGFFDYMFEVEVTAGFTLSNIVFDGNKDNVIANAAIVYNAGTLKVNSGGVLQNNHSNTNDIDFNYGGGVYNAGYFYMYNGSINDNESTFEDYPGIGGGVFNDYNGTFEMSGGEISGNTAGNGGGVYNAGYFYMYNGYINVSINDNEAEYGGGVYNDYYGTFEMSDGEISGNEAEYGGGGVANGGTFEMSGGEISGNEAEYGGGVYNDYNGTFELSDGYIIYNKAGIGGGVYNNNYGTFEMIDGYISYNEALCNDDWHDYYAGCGGGVYNNNYGTFELYGGSINDNAAYVANNYYGIVYNSGGGGVYNNCGTFEMYDGVISHNITDTDGGGVYNYCGTFELYEGIISGNETESTGGGVYNLSGTFEMSGGEISGNKAGIGGGVCNSDAARFGFGNYGLGSSSYATFEMSGGKISSNEAAVAGGGVYNSSFSHSYQLSITEYTDWYYGIFEMSGGEISGNSADEGGGVYNVYHALGDYWRGVNDWQVKMFDMSGGEVSGNEATRNGGGVWNSGVFEMSDGEISGNTAESGGGVYNSARLYYSPLFNNTNWIYGIFEMSDGEISDNTATDGGGVYNYGIFEMSDGEISDNTATGNGGGIYNTGWDYLDTWKDGIVNMSGGEISGNEALAGGGVWNDAIFEMSNGEISDNTAIGNGGGVFNVGEFDISDGEISGNTAGVHGGGIYAVEGNTLRMGGGSIIDNTADSDGGGVYAENYEDLFLYGSVEFSGNEAGSHYKPPTVAPVPAAQWTGTISSISRVLLGNNNITVFNNYDINYTNDTEPEIYTVTFVTNNRMTMSAQIVSAGETATMPAALTQQGYIFGGWYLDNGTFENLYNFSTPVTSDITLYAKWTPINTEGPEKPPVTGDGVIMLNWILTALMALTLCGVLIIKRWHKAHID